MGQNTKCLCKRRACAADPTLSACLKRYDAYAIADLPCKTKSIINSFHNKKRTIPSDYAAGTSAKGNAK